MQYLHWFNTHGYDLLEAFAIVASLVFTAVSLRREERSRHTGNLLAVAAAHRDIWSALYDRPELARILESNVDLTRKPLTVRESLFVTFVIHHLNTCYRAAKVGMFVTVGALEEDIRWFFSLPIPRLVWEKSKSLQDPDFVEFVEHCRGN